MEDVGDNDRGSWLGTGWKYLVGGCASCFMTDFGNADDFIIYLFLSGGGDRLEICTIRLPYLWGGTSWTEGCGKDSER